MTEPRDYQPDPTMRCTEPGCAYHWSGWDTPEDRAHYRTHPNGGGYAEDPEPPELPDDDRDPLTRSDRRHGTWYHTDPADCPLWSPSTGLCTGHDRGRPEHDPHDCQPVDYHTHNPDADPLEPCPDGPDCDELHAYRADYQVDANTYEDAAPLEAHTLEDARTEAAAAAARVTGARVIAVYPTEPAYEWTACRHCGALAEPDPIEPDALTPPDDPDLAEFDQYVRIGMEEARRHLDPAEWRTVTSSGARVTWTRDAADNLRPIDYDAAAVPFAQLPDDAPPGAEPDNDPDGLADELEAAYAAALAARRDMDGGAWTLALAYARQLRHRAYRARLYAMEPDNRLRRADLYGLTPDPRDPDGWTRYHELGDCYAAAYRSRPNEPGAAVTIGEARELAAAHADYQERAALRAMLEGAPVWPILAAARASGPVIVANAKAAARA